VVQAQLAVRLTPRGGADRIDGWASDCAGRPILKVRVRALPVEGEANAALEKLIAKTLAVPRSSVDIVAGQTARIKHLRIEGLTLEDTLSRLPPRERLTP
jgi:uncharacterized protein YggU (UPF0235/DUF167 family)